MADKVATGNSSATVNTPSSMEVDQQQQNEFTTKDLKPNGKKWSLQPPSGQDTDATANNKAATGGGGAGTGATTNNASTNNSGGGESDEVKRHLEKTLAKNGGARVSEGDLKQALAKVETEKKNLTRENEELKKFKEASDRKEEARLMSLQKSVNDIFRRYDDVEKVLTPEVEQTIVKGVTKASNPHLVDALNRSLTVYSRAVEGLESIVEQSRGSIRDNERLVKENAALKAEVNALRAKSQVDSSVPRLHTNIKQRFQPSTMESEELEEGDEEEQQNIPDEEVAEEQQQQEQVNEDENQDNETEQQQKSSNTSAEAVMNELVDKRVREVMTSLLGGANNKTQQSKDNELGDPIQAQEQISKLSFGLNNFASKNSKPANQRSAPAANNQKKILSSPNSQQQQQKRVKFAQQQQQSGSGPNLAKTATSAASADHKAKTSPASTAPPRAIQNNEFGDTRKLDQLYREMQEAKLKNRN